MIAIVCANGELDGAADYVDSARVLHCRRMNGGLALAGRSYPDVSSAASRIR